MKINGLDELQKQLKKIEKEVQSSLNGEIPLDQIFSREFMRKNSNFSSIKEFFDKAPFDVQNQKDFEQLDEAELDKYTRENTKYSYWQDFFEAAGNDYAAKKLKSLGFDVN